MRSRLFLSIFLGCALLGVIILLALRRSPASDVSFNLDSSPVKAETLAQRHSLADVGWRLIVATQRKDHLLESAATPISLLGGTEISAPEWFTLVRSVYPTNSEILAQFPDASWESQGECGGALYKGGWVVTAAHCVVDRDGSAPLRVEICVQPQSRSTCRATYVLHQVAVDLGYEPDGAAGFREDRAVMKLPDDPGNGLNLPQTPRAEIEPGEHIHIFAMGLNSAGELAEQVSRCSQQVVDVRRTIVETRAGTCRIRRADSGSLAGRELPSGEIVPLLIASSYDPRDETRNFYAPLRPDKIRDAMSIMER